MAHIARRIPLVPLGLFLLSLLYMLPALRPPSGAEALDGSDLVNQAYPLLSQVFDAAHDGRAIPLWNPYQFAGQSIVSNPQSAITYPPAWLMAITGVPRGVGYLIFLHLFWGAWGMALFVGELGAPRAGMFAGGAVYGFSALMGAHLGAGHFSYLLAQAWVPWVAWLALRSMAHPSQWPWSLAAAAALGMCILTGYPPLLYFTGIWLAALWLFWSAQQRSWRPRLLALRSLLVIGVVGALLGAAVLVPTGQLTLTSTRAEGSLQNSNSYAMPGGGLLTLVFPNLFGHPRLEDHGYWGLPFYEELTAYAGILPLIALFLVRMRPAKVLFGAFAVIGVVLSLGVDGGLFTVLYYSLPGYGLFRVPPRALYFVTVGGAGLVALLFTDLLAATPDERRLMLRPAVNAILPLLFVLALVGALALTGYFTALSASQDPPWRAFYSGNMLGVAAVAIGATWIVLRLWMLPAAQRALRPLTALTLALIVLDVWHISAPMVTVSAVDVPPHWALMAEAAPATPDFRVMTVPNSVVWQATSAYTRHLNADGYDPLVGADYQRLLAAANANPVSPVAALLGVRYFYADQEWPWDPSGQLARLVHDGPAGYIYETTTAWPRAFVAPTHVVMTDEDALSAIRGGNAEPEAAILSAPVDCPADPADDNLVAQAEILEYAPNVVRLRARSGGGILILTDAYDPNWTATVDGTPTPILRAYTALRGLCVASGDHEVVLRYQPTAFYAGVLLTLITWAGVGAALLLAAARLARERAR